MSTREDLEESLKKLMNDGLDLSDKIMKSENQGVIIAAICIMESFFQNTKPVELAIMKKAVASIHKEIDGDKKGTFNA